MKVHEGEVYDCNGVPIYCGDLVRSFHFKGCGQRAHYLYHVATWNIKEETVEMIPASALNRDDGGRYWLTQEYGDALEIISGTGPWPDCACHHDRPRRE